MFRKSKFYLMQGNLVARIDFQIENANIRDYFGSEGAFAPTLCEADFVGQTHMWRASNCWRSQRRWASTLFPNVERRLNLFVEEQRRQQQTEIPANKGSAVRVKIGAREMEGVAYQTTPAMCMLDDIHSLT
jgi:hypothetical protein